jgi:hypothetical protein
MPKSNTGCAAICGDFGCERLFVGGGTYQNAALPIVTIAHVEPHSELTSDLIVREDCRSSFEKPFTASTAAARQRAPMGVAGAICRVFNSACFRIAEGRAAAPI